ncbi:hypothetical protein ACF0H5_019315 [Mactra antiquata]
MKISALLSGLLLVAVLSQGEAVCPHGCRSCTNGMFYCLGTQLQSIPSEIPADTTVVDLTQNSIRSFQGIPNLPKVQSFRMSVNQLRVIKGDMFEKMPLITSLDLSKNSITKVYKHGLRGLNDLKSISLNENNIQEIGMVFWNTKAVNTIRLGSNVIQKIDEENFQKNEMLKMLDLSNNQIASIHGNAFKNQKMLRYLILSNNPLKQLDNLVFSSTMLSLADFSNCQLESVPRTMPSSLMDYRLGNNMITRIEVNDFENITSLTLLTLNDNKISQVAHRSFHTTKNLKELWLSRNDLVYIPRGLPKGLVKLFIDNNVVVELEPRLFQEDSSLKELTLEGNKVRKVHQESLATTKELEKLNLQGNELSLIDIATFDNLPKLQSLILTENPIQVFEKGAFNNLDSLTDLQMSYIDHPKARQDKMVQENFLLSMPSLTTLNMMNSIKLSKALMEIIGNTNNKELDRVENVNLQYCELTTLNQQVKRLFPNVKQFLLDENLLHCDQRLLWLQDWMKTRSDIMFYQYEEPKCNSPSSLKGRAISSLEPYEFVAISEPESVTQIFSYPEEPIIEQPDQGQGSPDVTETDQSNPQNSDTSSAVQPAETNTIQKQSHRPPLPPSGNSRKSLTGLSGKGPSSGTVGGTRVVIKPPKSATTGKDNEKEDKTKLTKAEKKALRKAERERKRRERIERRRRAKNDDARRKKRRIRNEKSKNCTTDKNGNKKCRRKNRCQVQPDGTTKCRKRKGKGKKKKMEATSS